MAAQTNFIDIATIWLHAGKGGDGAVSFHREKFVAAGGPDGGDGGRGGDIIFVVDDHLTTLMDFRYKRKYVAPEGGKGGASLCHGKNAENLVIKVPLGTVIFMFASLLYLKVPVLASVISVVSVNLLIYLAFVQFLGVRLPKGLLF